MVLAIALGGAAGTLLRWWIGTLMPATDHAFPLGTLLVNVSGSFALGFLARSLLATSVPPELRLALTVGVCGGFTTFSTFALESVRLLEAGHVARASAYVTASVVLSLAATAAGLSLARTMLRDAA
jgi:CrcB protein